MATIQKDLETFHDIAQALFESEITTPVSQKIPTSELYDTLDLSLPEEPLGEDAYKAMLQEAVLATPKTASKLFFNQLFGGRQSKAVLGDLLAVLLNNSMYTYKVAGPQVGIEKIIINKLATMIGYGAKSGGTFPTGGSMSNYMGIIMARDAFNPEIRNTGVQQQLIAYTSSESHYSNAKNAAFAGIGRANVRYISCNAQGEMIPEALEDQIRKDLDKGFHPFYVNATAGTTVLGAFDPLEPIADICERYNIWLHVDGAYCGAVLFSENYKHLIQGVERADSFSFNAHKMLGTPLTCSIILVKDKKHLYTSFSNDADYLYQGDQDDFNLGKTSFQCGRRNDALKFWTLWKAIGSRGLKQLVDTQFELATIARDYVQQHPDYTLYSFDNSISVCFNYKDIPADVLCTALYDHQQAVVGFGSFRETTFVRLVTINATNTKDDILNFFKVIERFVAKGHLDVLQSKSS